MTYHHIDINKVMAELTLEEKISLVCGKDCWCTRDIPRLGIPSTMMCDGPTGLRKCQDVSQITARSVPATCFPTACVLASTWNRARVQKVGEAIGVECRAEKVSTLLGPGNNIKRSPLCGRNFEYYSEDPYAAAQLASAYVRGVQSQGVGTSLKHFCANNQETNRFSVNELIDERTLREIYLAAFESVVKDAQPWTVMSSYNRVNNEYVVSSRHFMTDVLRNEFGFEGIVVSDWGAVDDRAKALHAGMDLEMPSTYGQSDIELRRLVVAGKLDGEQLDACVRRLLVYVDRCAATLALPVPSWDVQAHHRLAYEAAAEGIVLLKNDNAALPLKGANLRSVAVIGEFATKPRYQGGGSSYVNATNISSALEELQTSLTDWQYVPGYHIHGGQHDATLQTSAVNVAKSCDAAVVFVGLSEEDESEGFDRQHMRLPEHHNTLVSAVAAVNARTIVVLTNASAVEMPWADSVQAIVEAYLPGQAGAAAVAHVLTGKVNPSGKLSESFPKRLEDTSAFLNFPGKYDVTYSERLYVGYRYYDKRRTEVLFPFGHGLSYTTFAYSAVQVAKTAYVDSEDVEASVTVTNTGSVAGAEVVQLYVRDVESLADRPEKELKDFEKVFLAPGELKTVTFTLNRRAFAYYDVPRKDWVVEAGDFELLFASSSRDVRGAATVTVTPAVPPPPRRFDRNSMIGDVCFYPPTASLASQLRRDFTQSSHEPQFIRMLQQMEVAMPIRTKVIVGEGHFSFDDMDALIAEANRLSRER